MKKMIITKTFKIRSYGKNKQKENSNFKAYINKFERMQINMRLEASQNSKKKLKEQKRNESK